MELTEQEQQSLTEVPHPSLPPGSLVVVRAREARRRAALAAQLSFARLLIADDPALAAEVGVGLHLPESRIREAPHWRVRHPHWIITASAHGSARMRCTP